MKKHIVNSWSNKKNNPYDDTRYDILEAPISEPLPGASSAEDQAAASGNPSDFDSQDPNLNAGPPEAEDQNPVDNVGPVNSDPSPENQEMDDFTSEPEIDFQAEKIDYMNLALGQKHDEMMDKLLEMRDIENLSPGEYKFIEDNINVLSLSRDIDFADAQKKIYKRIKEQFAPLADPGDGVEIPEIEPSGTAPGAEAGITISQEPTEQPQYSAEHYNSGQGLKSLTEATNELGEISGLEMYSIISQEIERYEEIKNSLLKLPSFYSMKADLFRKILCSVLNGVQIGSGGTLEDIFIPLREDGVGIKACTRCYTDFGNIEIGKWTLNFDDPEQYLSEEELKKLNIDGSPEEREVLRKRVVIESLADKFIDKIYLILIVDPNNGSRTEVGINFSELLREGWKNGNISINFKASVGKGEAAINQDGELIDLKDIVVNYIKENPDNLDEEGAPVKEEIELMKQKNGNLYISAPREDFENFVNTVEAGIFFDKKHPEFDKEQLTVIQRCVPDIKEFLLKKCSK